MTLSIPRSRIWMPVTLFALTVVVLVAGLLYSRPSTAAPGISWLPSAVSEAILPGGTKSISISFIATENMGNATVTVVPALQSYVQVSPTTFASVTKGDVIGLTVTLAVPSAALPGTIDGTIHVRLGTSTIAKPLPVTINIVWPTTTTQAGVTFAYPGTYSLHKELNDLTDTVSLTNFGARYLSGGLIPPGGADVVFATLPPPAEGFDAFLAEKLSEATVESRETVYVDGLSATRVQYTHQFGPKFSMRFVAVFVPVPGALHRIVLAYNVGEPREADLLNSFQMLMNSVQLPK